MSRYEMSLSSDYVPNWTLVDAVRELFQNALDQQTQSADNPMFVYYDGVHLLHIGNKQSVLEKSSLLLGSSTKRDDESTIGQFGEGYKIAALVLTRLGHKVTFFNYGKREIWRPRFVESKRYGSTILVFDIEQNAIWNTPPLHDLIITVDDIGEEEYEAIVESNLHMQDVGEIIEAQRGRILLDEKYKGKVYVNGLYICQFDQYHKGYDIKPQYIKLDRDRKLVSDWDLRWLASQIWNSVDSPILLELAKLGAADVGFVKNTSTYVNNDRSEMYNTAYMEFVKEHGKDAIPVITQTEMEEASKFGTPIIVPETQQHLIASSPIYQSVGAQVRRMSLKDEFYEWLRPVRHRLAKAKIQEFDELVSKIRDY